MRAHLQPETDDCLLIRRTRAFTLVELLVVIGIIALLISILLPALSKAQEEGKRITCLSNLRSFGTVLNMYANDNKGRMPLGYAGTKHAGYMVYISNAYQVLGTLEQTSYLKAGVSAFYCPSKTDERFMFNTANNPWPPPIASPGIIRLGMTVRPSVQFSGMVPSSSTDDNALWRGKFPNIANYKDKAIAAEMFGEPMNDATVNVDPSKTSHKNLINVYYADNSASAVDIRPVDPVDNESILTILKKLAALKAVPSGAAASQIYLDEVNTPNRGMWHKFDLEK